MDSDYCLICDKKTLGGIYCSQTCRLLDLENNNCSTGHEHRQSTSEESVGARSNSFSNSPSTSPQFTPTRAGNLPYLPILNTLDRYLSRSSPFTTITKSTTNYTPNNENTSIWRRRSTLFYAS